MAVGAPADIGEVRSKKREALAAHKSQKAWLDASQGFDSYLTASETMDREIGERSGKFEFAEGWRRHSHIGFSNIDQDPLADALKEKYLINQDYENSLR